MNTLDISILLDGDIWVIPECCQFTIVLALHELADIAFHPITGGPYGQAYCSGGFTLSITGINVDISFIVGLFFHLLFYLKKGYSF
jgi:hypothetical protein